MDTTSSSVVCSNIDCPCTCIRYLRGGRPSDALIEKVDNLIEHIVYQLGEQDFDYKGIVDAMLRQIEMLGFDQYLVIDAFDAIDWKGGRKELDAEGVNPMFPWHYGGRLDRMTRPNHTYLESE